MNLDALLESARSAFAPVQSWFQSAPSSVHTAFYVLVAVALTAWVVRRRERPVAPTRATGTALALRPRTENLGELLSAFESETAAVFERTSPAREHAVLLSLVAMMLLACGLTAVVKVDRVVTGVGRIVPPGGELYVSPLDRSIIREVRVREGDVVTKGQTLATMDPTFAGADLAQLQQRLASQEAEAARRAAEVESRTYQAGTDPYSRLQHGIWLERQAEYRSTLEDFDARINAAQSEIAQHTRDIAEYRKRHGIALQNEQMNVDLRQKGYVTQAAVNAATDARVEVGRLLANSESQLATTRHTLDSVRAQRAAYIQKWRSEATSSLVEVRNDIDRLREELRKAEKLNQLVTLEAPADAVVLKIGKVSTGSIAASGGDAAQEPLFTLMPLTDTLEAEIRISTSDIGFINPGDEVNLKLDAYSFVRHGTARGVIKTISEGSFTRDETNGAMVDPYFRARVKIEELNLRDVSESFRLIPGMTLQADVMVGSRTILSYLVEGMLRTGAEAMREPY